MSTASFPAFISNVKRIAIQIMIGLALLCAGVVCALAQNGDSQMHSAHQQTQEQKSRASALLQIVRDSTEHFKDVSVAEAFCYSPTPGTRRTRARRS